MKMGKKKDLKKKGDLGLGVFGFFFFGFAFAGCSRSCYAMLCVDVICPIVLFCPVLVGLCSRGRSGLPPHSPSCETVFFLSFFFFSGRMYRYAALTGVSPR
ncbi:hypothetical protein DFP73DRAFT_556954 [Morchella snyderi]|nr:hypothetical protein DFP73DRAFT_556954 [Morchella snyderi]